MHTGASVREESLTKPVLYVVTPLHCLKLDRK